jgi:hypothetical protein
MGRKRANPRDSWLPTGVYPDVKGGRYIVRSQKLTGGKEVRLCSLQRNRAQVLDAFDTFTTNVKGNTLDTLIREYMKSTKFTSLAVRTQSDYRKYYNALSAVTFNQGQSLMTLAPQRVTKGLARQILDARANDGAPVQGNRAVKGLLSAVFTWALSRDLVPGMTDNPCHGVERNKESTGREHYAEQWELKYALARATPDYLPIVMRLCYFLYARIVEVQELLKTDLIDEGVLMRRRKGSKNNIIEWDAELEAAVNAALSLKREISSVYLLHDDQGQPLQYSAIRNAWDRCMARCVKDAAAEGLVFRPFTRHDMKRKGMNDTSQLNPAGHKTEAMRQRYRVKPEVVRKPG